MSQVTRFGSPTSRRLSVDSFMFPYSKEEIQEEEQEEVEVDDEIVEEEAAEEFGDDIFELILDEEIIEQEEFANDISNHSSS